MDGDVWFLKVLGLVGGILCGLFGVVALLNGVLVVGLLFLVVVFLGVQVFRQAEIMVYGDEKFRLFRFRLD